jgi:hypothetical protein
MGLAAEVFHFILHEGVRDQPRREIANAVQPNPQMGRRGA